MPVEAAGFLAGLGLFLVGADRTVDAAAETALCYGVSTFFIGVVAPVSRIDAERRNVPVYGGAVVLATVIVRIRLDRLHARRLARRARPGVLAPRNRPQRRDTLCAALSPLVRPVLRRRSESRRFQRGEWI
jgi:hypothetical protein